MATKPPEPEMQTHQLNFQTWILKVSIHCQGCKRKVKRVLQSIEGVYTTDIEGKQHKVTVTGNIDAETLIKKLARSGKHAQLWPDLNPPTTDNNNSLEPEKSDATPNKDKLNNINASEDQKLGPNNQPQAETSGAKKKKKKKKNKSGNSGDIGGGSGGGAAAEAIKESPQNQDSIQYTRVYNAPPPAAIYGVNYNTLYSSGSASWSVPSIDQDRVFSHQPPFPPSDHIYKISYHHDHHDYGYDEDDAGCSVM